MWGLFSACSKQGLLVVAPGLFSLQSLLAVAGHGPKAWFQQMQPRLQSAGSVVVAHGRWDLPGIRDQVDSFHWATREGQSLDSYKQNGQGLGGPVAKTSAPTTGGLGSVPGLN